MNTQKWWRESGAVLRISPKFDGLTLSDVRAMLPQIKEAGFSVVEIFAPYHGGIEYHGLDGIDFTTVDPKIGTFDDFAALVSDCHRMNLRITVFLNLGYTALAHPLFEEAQRDIAAGKRTDATDCFLWTSDPSRRFERPLAPWFLQDAHGSWAYSEVANRYYWCKWFGQRGDVRLPQLNFGSEIWQRECVRIMDFWRESGIDGYVVDAVNWYMDCDWEINYRCMSAPAFANGELYLQPEGAGGFLDDPIPWIERGKYNSVQDYSLNLWWEGSDPLGDAIKSGHPAGLEVKLSGYRDRVVGAGGVTYAAVGSFREASPEERLLEIGFMLAAGEMLFFDYAFFAGSGRFIVDEGTRELLVRQRDEMALAPFARREHVFTDRDDCCFAMLRTHGGEGMLVVLNFARVPVAARVFLPDKEVLRVELPPLDTLWIKQ